MHSYLKLGELTTETGVARARRDDILSLERPSLTSNEKQTNKFAATTHQAPRALRNCLGKRNRATIR